MSSWAVLWGEGPGVQTRTKGKRPETQGLKGQCKAVGQGLLTPPVSHFRRRACPRNLTTPLQGVNLLTTMLDPLPTLKFSILKLRFETDRFISSLSGSVRNRQKS